MGDCLPERRKMSDEVAALCAYLNHYRVIMGLPLSSFVTNYWGIIGKRHQRGRAEGTISLPIIMLLSKWVYVSGRAG